MSFFPDFLRTPACILLVILGSASAASADTSLPPGDSVTSKPFGKTPQGELVTLHTLTNKNGLSVSVMDYGATIVKILAPDRNGKLADIVLGFDKFAPYLHQTAYFGATIGRYANRIADGRFQLNGETLQLSKNDGANSFHGGTRGFDKRMWNLEPVESDIPAVRFSRLSPDGEEGYSGNLFTSVTFSLNDENELRISYEATTDKPTIINLANHSYFNLAGSGTILSHLLTVHAASYTPVNASLIPTGEIKPVAGTPFDFLTATPLGFHLNEAGGKPPGYDLNFVLQKGFFFNWSLAAELDDPQSGRTMTISTDQPGLQLYTGNMLGSKGGGGSGGAYHTYGGVAFETQHYPDSPHHDNFPSTVLNPGDTYKTSTVYAFGVK